MCVCGFNDLNACMYRSLLRSFEIRGCFVFQAVSLFTPNLFDANTEFSKVPQVNMHEDRQYGDGQSMRKPRYLTSFYFYSTKDMCAVCRKGQAFNTSYITPAKEPVSNGKNTSAPLSDIAQEQQHEL